MEKARVVSNCSNKRGNKESKNKKKVQQPLKVVYITNPMKFTATTSQFRALVQELTGKYADVPDSSRFVAAEGGAAKVHAAAEVVGLQGEGEGGGGGAEKGTSTTSGSYEEDEGFCYTPEMIDNFHEGLEASRLWHDEDDVDDLDLFKRLGAM